MARRKRPQAAPQAKYDAAGSGRRIKSWSPPASGPNRATEGLQKIRNRSRDTARNDWAGESGLQKWATNLIGVGITPRWEDEALTKRWQAFVPQADADGVLDAYGLQTLGTRSMLDSGEVFMRRRPRSLALPLSAPVQFQLIEADFVPLFDADVWPGLPAGNNIRQGIERNKFGRRVAYWMYREHPGDKLLGAQPATTDLIRVAAEDVAHVFEPKRPGQLRGVSMLAPVLVRLRASMDFEDAVLDRQKLANLFTLFVTRSMPDSAEIDYDPLTGLPVFYDQEGKALVGLEPGISQTLLPGEDVKFANPPEAGTTFSEYMRTTHLGTAAGAGLPYELFSGDLQNVSDRTLRVAINEFRRFAKQRQWQTLIPQMCQKMVDWWAAAEVLGGGIAVSDFEAAKSPKWSPHGWEYIHPTQDAEGKKIEVEAGFRSRSDVIGERGDDARSVDEERADDLKRSKALGLEPPPPPKPAAPPRPTVQAVELDELLLRRERAAVKAIENPPPPPGPTATETALVALLALQQQQAVAQAAQAAQAAASTAQLLSHVAELAAREAPVVENHMHLSPTPIENHTHVSPTPLTVVNEVQPAEVKAVIEMPARKTESDITRDPEGQIVKFVQTETTIQ